MKKTVILYLNAFENGQNEFITVNPSGNTSACVRTVAAAEVDVEFTDVKTWQQVDDELKAGKAEEIRLKIESLQRELETICGS